MEGTSVTQGFHESVPPNMPPPSPLPAMPPPIPGTGLHSQVPHQTPAPALRPSAGFFPPAPIYPVAVKSVGLAYVLWFFFGLFGVQHFYLGKVGRGVGYLLTFAWFTVGWWVDLFTLPSQVTRANAYRRFGLR